MLTRAIITSKFRAKSYASKAVAHVESTHIDSSMDTDSDGWQISIGDVDDDLIETLRRDTEVRVAIYAFDSALQALHMGFADEVTIDESETLQISGRDVSAPAVDSILLPHQYKHVRPHTFVAQQARSLGIGGRLRLAHGNAFKKFNTDGTESFWEAWYRIYRKRRMWLWCEPDGYIVADGLNYTDDASYFIGTPTSSHRSKHFLPVERAEWRKNTTERVGQVFVIGSKGDNEFMGKAADPTTSQWIKRPRRIVQSTDAHNEKQAIREAWEEIFESKVGSVEWRVVIANPGHVIRQNRMAFVNIPKIGLKGTMFIVGTRIAADENGFYQEVRLREKNFAISRRKPDDPVLSKGHDDLTPEQIALTTGHAGVNAHGIRWWDYFVDAARATHGQYGFTQWLGFLLACCEPESGFFNSREGHEGVDWRPPPPRSASGEDVRLGGGAYQKWRNEFANNPGNPLSPHSYGAGVGPMQLTTMSYKQAADARGIPAYGVTAAQSHADPEYLGGRWNPRHNIMQGAVVLHSYGKGYPGRDSFFREIYAHYNGGPRPPSVSYARADHVMKLYREKYFPNIPGWIKADTTSSPDSGINPKWNRYVTAAVSFLKHQLGKRYVWGAAGPTTYDCSGLAGQAWHFAGVRGFTSGGPGTRYGTTDTFFAYKPASAHMTPVKKAHLLAGDFVLFGSPGNVHHMGVAIGDGQYIEAPYTGAVVRVRSLASRTDFMGGRRHPQMWPSIAG